MIDLRYSQMTTAQLTEIIKQLEKEEKSAKQAGLASQADIFTQKKWLARSYLVDRHAIKPGQSYVVVDADDLFTVSYLNGIMAWGHWNSSTVSVAIPIAKLKISEQLED